MIATGNRKTVDLASSLARSVSNRSVPVSRDDSAEYGLGLACELERLPSGRFTHAPNRRLARHVRKHAMQWFWFLIDPAIQATNHWAEQAMRPAVVNRKVWGGATALGAGAQAQSILMSMIRICSQRDLKPFTFLLQVLCRHSRNSFPRETVMNYFTFSPAAVFSREQECHRQPR